MLVATLSAPGGNITRVHLTSWHVNLVTAHYDLNAISFDTIAAHFFLPVEEGSEAVLVVHIIHHNDAVCILVKLLPNESIIIIAGQVKEVDRDRLSFDCQFFHSIIYTDSGNVALDESTLAIALDQATLAHLLVSHRCDFETNLIRRRHVSVIACWHFSLGLGASASSGTTVDICGASPGVIGLLGGIASFFLASFLLSILFDAPNQVRLLETVVFFHTKGVQNVLKLLD
mmetsp:Transcript_14977/g.18883  ORF Transcript_14977/g.18883 Transcript_14977/m.18883 type:complete len:230 (-) Transcript_14977:405-1094(-)